MSENKMHIIWVLLIFYISPLFATDLLISWFENSEPDLAGYNLYYGEQSGFYDNQVNAGLANEFVLHDLQDQTEYYFALTAIDTAGNESGFSAEAMCILNDTVPLRVDSIRAQNAFTLLLYFNKKIQNIEAVNLEIDGGTVIEGVSLLSNKKTVRLITSHHNMMDEYHLTLSNVQDIALPPNILENVTLNYKLQNIIVEGGMEALIEIVGPVSLNEINLFYNLPVNAAITGPADFVIGPDIEIFAVEQAGEKQLKLVTGTHQPGVLYSLNVNGPAEQEEDTAPARTHYYSIPDGSALAPVIKLLDVTQPDKVQIVFDNPVRSDVLERFSLDPDITVYGAELDSSEKIVTLNTDIHQPNKHYSLNYKEIQDNGGNEFSESRQIEYQYQSADSMSPAFKTFEFINSEQLKLVFTEPLYEKTAVDPQNYSIDHHVQVLNVELSPAGDEVTLFTTPHTAFQQYTLSLNGLTDGSFFKNEMAGPTDLSYIYSPNNVVMKITNVDFINTTIIDVYYNTPLSANNAQDFNHYSIDNNQVLQARLTSNDNVVRLTTLPHETNTVYTLHSFGLYKESLGGFQDQCEQVFSYTLPLKDSLGPVIKTVYARGPENLLVLFNKPVSVQDAETISNYTIPGGPQILDAQMNGSGDMVHLRTGPHSRNDIYTLRTSNISQKGNSESMVASQFQYKVKLADQVAPHIRQIRAVSFDRVHVVFNEPVFGPYLARPESWSVDHDVQIEHVNVIAPGVIELQTTPHEPGVVYGLSVHGVTDLAGNETIRSQAWEYGYHGLSLSRLLIDKVYATGPDQILIEFSHNIDPKSAKNIDHYTFRNNIQPANVQIIDKNRVLLTLNSSLPGRGEVFWIDGIEDQEKERVCAREPFYVYFDAFSQHSLAIESVTMQGADRVAVRFSQKLQWDNVEDIANYQIFPETEIYRAVLKDDDQTVVLYTDDHFPALPYRITISNIQPQAADVEGESIYYDSYIYLPILEVFGWDQSQISSGPVKVGAPYYIDRNYVITGVPPIMTNATLIKTANNEKSNDSDEFLSLQLTGPAVVSIAYDKRAESVPEWLSAKFVKTDMDIGVSDQVENLNVWQGYFNTGNVVLGGNTAKGASGVKSMYVVLLDVPTLENMRELEQISTGPEHTVPDRFSLAQNFPNPFNPVTLVKYELCSDQFVELSVYNILGQKVKTLVNSIEPAGYHLASWNATNNAGNLVAAGVYFYRLEVWDQGAMLGKPIYSRTRKMLLLK